MGLPSKQEVVDLLVECAGDRITDDYTARLEALEHLAFIMSVGAYPAPTGYDRTRELLASELMQIARDPCSGVAERVRALLLITRNGLC